MKIFGKKHPKHDTGRIDDEGSKKQEIRYPKPRILALDLDSDDVLILENAGYNVQKGSLGKPYKIKISDKYQLVGPNENIPPGYGENDLVIIDLYVEDFLEKPGIEKEFSLSEPNIYAKCNVDYIDPRKVTANVIQKDLDRLYEHGGNIIIFAHFKLPQNLIVGHHEPYGFVHDNEISIDEWDFLEILDSLNVQKDVGSEIAIHSTKIPLSSILDDQIESSFFTCTLDPHSYIQKRWFVLAENKFGKPVSGVLLPDEEIKGWIYIFPQVANKGILLIRLLSDVLPLFSPDLFPFDEKHVWLQSSIYELPHVIDLRNEIIETEEETKRKIQSIEDKIARERENYGFMHELITSSGDDLVNAVIASLKKLGFQKIKKGDEEQKIRKKTNREDIQIADKSPLILIEVKGMSGIPSEADALQVSKYLAPRMKQLKRTDIKGLFVVNHERNIPPLSRNFNNLFTEDVLTNAENQEIGLITTWEIYRLVRSHLKLGWPNALVMDIFYRSGRIDIVPMHYEFIGTIDKVFPQVPAIGITIARGEVETGALISVELKNEYDEQIIQSMQSDDVPIELASVGVRAGIRADFPIHEIREGMRIFRVHRE